MKHDAKIYVAGHAGMVGSAIIRNLQRKGYHNFVCRTHKELDLTCQGAVEQFFSEERPEYVFLAAARVGGIGANMNDPAEFLLDNILIQCNVIQNAFRYNVKKLLFVGSSSIYPREAPQPLKEEYLLTGPMEPTNEGYALAKIVGLKLCEYYHKQYNADFISVMPCNLYGYYDNFDEKYSNIVPALIRRFHEAKINDWKSVTVWGTGRACRELLFADDMADASIYIMEHYSDTGFINIGYGRDYTILEIAEMVKKVVGYAGEIEFDTSKPEGMPRRIVDSSRLDKLGWKPLISLEEGLRLTYQWYTRQENNRGHIQEN